MYLEVYNEATPLSAYYLIVRMQSIFTHEEWGSINSMAANFGSR